MISVSLTLLCLLSFGPPQSEEVTARFGRALELQRQGAWKAAAAEYRGLLAIAPDYAEAQANLGAVLSRLGDYGAAVAAYEAALRLKPGLTPILLNLGIAHYRVGQFGRAVEALERFLAVAPDHLQARQLIGNSLVELGRDAEAVAHLEPTLTAAPEDLTVLYSLGTAYLRLHSPELSSIVRRLSARPEGAALAGLLRAQAHLESFEFEKAAAELENVAKFSEDLPRLHFLRGVTCLKLGRFGEARGSFERELARTPGDFLTLYYLAALLEKQGDLGAARERAEAALRQEPQSLQAATLLGSILLREGRAAEAVSVLEPAAARQPSHAETRYLLARGYQKLGRTQESAREFAEVKRLKAQEQERERRPVP